MSEWTLSALVCEPRNSISLTDSYSWCFRNTANQQPVAANIHKYHIYSYLYYYQSTVPLCPLAMPRNTILTNRMRRQKRRREVGISLPKDGQECRKQKLVRGNRQVGEENQDVQNILRKRSEIDEETQVELSTCMIEFHFLSYPSSSWWIFEAPKTPPSRNMFQGQRPQENLPSLLWMTKNTLKKTPPYPTTTNTTTVTSTP